MPSLRILGLAALLLLPLASCGAGLVTGAIASNNNSNPPAARAPVLTVPEPRLPLVPATAAAARARTVVIANASLRDGDLRVEVRADGMAPVVQSAPVVSGQVVGFQLVTQPLVDHFGALADVPATLAVLLDGREVAPPVPVLLVRQPRAELDAPGGRLLLSSNGGTRARLLVQGLRSTGDVQMTVTTADASGQTAAITRVCTNLAVTELAGVQPQTFAVEANAPGNTFAGAARLVVEDPIAGRSTEATAVFYQPEVSVALPGQGPTTGGTLVTLIGRALAPLDFKVNPPAPDFDSISIQLQKGGRLVELPASELRRAESSVDRLVFTMPPSPDGRPGQLHIVLTVAPNVSAETDLFLFANPLPVFGPRGAVLDRAPVAVAPIELESAPSTGVAPDFGVVYSEGGVGFLQLLAAQENGMFIRFGPPQRIGNAELAAERDPRDLATGDLDNDGVPDFLLANAGVGNDAAHHIVLGRSSPNPPIGAIKRVSTEGGVARCRIADFDGDGRRDLLLVPRAGAVAGAQPHVFLSNSFAGSPQFVDVGRIPARSFAYDAVEIADFDGDNRLDVALFGGGAQPKLDIAYGDGNGTFTVGTQLDLVVPNYVPDAASPGVGVHMIHDGNAVQIALVFAGLPPIGAVPPHPVTPPVVALLRQTAPRVFAQPTPPVPGVPPNPGSVLVVPLEPLGSSLAADMDGDGVEELVIGVADTSAVPIGLLRFTPAAGVVDAHFEPVPNGVQVGSEPIRRITALHFGIASPADRAHNRDAVRAVFVVHESETDGIAERRLSSLLVFATSALPPNNGLTLLSADAGGPLTAPMRGVVTGNFLGVSVAADNGDRAARDLALATSGSATLLPGVIMLGNDGFGGFAPSLTMHEDHILPETTVRLPAARGLVESMAWLTDDGHLGIWRPDESAPSPQAPTWRTTEDLRQFATDPRLRNAAVDPTSTLTANDVDGDGVLDLVVLLRFSVPAPRVEGDALLLVLRGRARPSPGELPFALPSDATAVHGNASSIALGDFTPESAGRALMELALAVPTGTSAGAGDGDHVRFYRLVPGSDPATLVWRRSFSQRGDQVLLAGNQPTRLAAADFDGDGTIDLLVAAAGDASLRLFLNSGLPAQPSAEVAIEAFHQSFNSPVPTGAGQPTFLDLGDINSDGNVDVLLTTESVSTAGVLSTSVGFYLSSGTGGLAGPTFVSRTRLGDRNARLAVDLGDCNGDGVPDIAASWETFGLGDRNVRVLFGGSR